MANAIVFQSNQTFSYALQKYEKPDNDANFKENNSIRRPMFALGMVP